MGLSWVRNSIFSFSSHVPLAVFFLPTFCFPFLFDGSKAYVLRTESSATVAHSLDSTVSPGSFLL